MIQAKVVGDRQVIVTLRATTDRLRTVVFDTVKRLGLRMEERVKTDWLSGRALHRRTGRLASSINTQFSATAQSATARVGTNVPYGAFWELGFHGTEIVRAHMRTMVFGRTVKPFTVPAFKREVNQAARPFLAPALAEMQPEIMREMQAAVDRAAAGERT
jgi:phage gpG-like protein